MLTDEQIKQKWIECTKLHRRGDVISSVDMATDLARWVESQTQAECDATQKRCDELARNVTALFGQFVNISLMTRCGGEVDEYDDVTASVREIVDERDKLQMALVEANGLLRSAYQIAARHGEATNWDAFIQQLEKVLNLEHPLVSEKK